MVSRQNPKVTLALGFIDWRAIDDSFTNLELDEWSRIFYSSTTIEVKKVIEVYWELYKDEKHRAKASSTLISTINRGASSPQFEMIYKEKFVIAFNYIRGSKLVMGWDYYHLIHLQNKDVNTVLKTQGKLAARGFTTPEIEKAGNTVIRAMAEYNKVCDIEFKRIELEKLGVRH